MNDDVRWCREALPGVSRTFALGIELLAEPLRDEVGVAYLVCRVLDTVEDTTSLPAPARAGLLERAAVEIGDPARSEGCAAAIEAMFEGDALRGRDHHLCRDARRVARALHAARPGAVACMRPTFLEMGRGMAETVRREAAGRGLQLETITDLERYCQYVAGTVGELLTSLFAYDRPSITGPVERGLRDRAARFGLGLQVVNIVKNVADDLGRGVAYVPRELLAAAGADLKTLASRPDDPRGRKVVARLVEHVVPWLDAAVEYTLEIPPHERDLRMFCGLPLAFALRTLALAVRGEGPFSERELKISRAEVAAIHLRLSAIVSDDRRLRESYAEERARVIRALARAGSGRG